MRSISKTLAIWREGYLSSEQVVAWAWAEVEAQASPPYALIELGGYGPEFCMKLPQADFPDQPSELTFDQRFSLRLLRVQPESEASVLAFAEWLQRACMEEDPENPNAKLGYRVDDAFGWDPAVALELVRQQLPVLRPACCVVAHALENS